MADTVERVRVIIEADGTARLVDGTRLSAEEMRKLGESLSNTGDKLESVGARSEKTGQQLAGMGRDIAQGDWRGAAENMGRMALSSGAAQAAASGLGVALGLGTTALVAWGVAMYQAREETERQANVMLLTGNYAGLVSGELNQAARDVAAGINGSVGNTRQTMEALVATGRVTNQSLAEMARGVELVSRFSGSSREAVTKDFAEMANGVADWAAKHNQSYHFITFEQYKYIEGLELAGNKQEAMRVTSELLSQHLGGDLARNMGVIERGWTGIKNVASSAWDAMLNVGRSKSSADRITEAAKALADAEAYLKAGARVAQVGGGSAQDGVDRARAELETAQESARLERRAADERSRRGQEEEARIAADREKKKKTDDGDSTYDRLNQAVQRRMALAQAEEDQGYRLAASERYRLEGLQQISDAEGKIGPQRAAQLRQLVNETAEVMRNNEARTDLIKTRQKNDEMLAKELASQERELATMMASNERLREQIEEVGLTTEQLGRLKAERIEATLATERENLVMAQNIEGNEAQVRIIERRIALMERQRDLTRQLGESKAAEQDRKEAAAEAKKFTDELRRDLSHALSHAFTNNKDPLEAFGAALENTIKVRASRGLAESLMNPIAKAFEQGAANWFSGAGNSGGGGFGTGSDYGNADYGSFFHEGGVVGGRPTFSRPVNAAVFNGAPRFHGGGITGDEVPIIAKRGEGVFTPGQMRALGAGMGGGATIVQNVKVINNTGSQVSVRQQSGNNGFDMSLILDAVDAGMADRVGAGEGALPRALEGRYNLQTAVN